MGTVAHTDMARPARATNTLESCIRGYHVYKDVWTTTVGEELQCARESDSSTNHYVVVILSDNEKIGHVLRKISRVRALFLEQNGEILCTIVGSQ